MGAIAMKTRFLTMFAVLLPAIAFASVGSVKALDGDAVRTPAGGAAVALAKGSAIELGDTLEVQKGSLQLELSDGSTLILAEHSKLAIDQATFSSLERRFSARLLLGSVWASVTHALEGNRSSFEIATDRAVAGVRGTVFRVDIDASHPDDPQTEVSVEEGLVAVRSRVAGAMAEQLLKAGEALHVLRDRFVRAVATRHVGGFEKFVREHRREAIERRERSLERLRRRR